MFFFHRSIAHLVAGEPFVVDYMHIPYLSQSSVRPSGSETQMGALFFMIAAFSTRLAAVRLFHWKREFTLLSWRG